jgi:hypothetical protein
LRHLPSSGPFPVEKKAAAHGKTVDNPVAVSILTRTVSVGQQRFPSSPAVAGIRLARFAGKSWMPAWAGKVARGAGAQ